jgi:hypothetical protein
LASPFLRLYRSALNSVVPAESIRGTGQGHSRVLVSSPRRTSVQDFKGACRELSLFFRGLIKPPLNIFSRHQFMRERHHSCGSSPIIRRT